ncbi:MAG: mechanosensitive ion channel [Calditrichaeota bacterium]|jgi:miniconductance mechanosensitive channel|nr:mechanosensitive ion channel [Calditrichota bacterium]MBT7789287.1 mechanosensitive ion channel [Calditrichota bacterium]
MTEISNFLNQYPEATVYAKLAGVLLLCLVVHAITRRYLLRGIEKLVVKSKTTYDDKLLKSGLFHRLALIAPAIVLYNFAHLFGPIEDLLRRILTAAIVLIAILGLGALLKSIGEILADRDKEQKFNFKTYVQISKLVLYIVGALICVAILTGQSPLVMISGLGAMTAVLLLVFRDTILSFVAGIQINSNDLVRVGDWIEVPKFGADGDVIDIALHTVRVQNWDKTITMIPTHKLIEESFKNWRGMTQSGGRRIMRAIRIDMSSVKFCDAELRARFGKMHLVKDYVQDRQKEIDDYNQKTGIDQSESINGRRMTNLGVFRAYLEAYLLDHPKIHNEMTFLVRQLSPGDSGIPIEIYVFTTDTNWNSYEAIQADIFDHIIAVTSRFDLTIFQNPSGRDFQGLVK